MTTIETRTKITHPFIAHAVAKADNIDELCHLLSIVKEQSTRLKACEYECRSALALLTQGETKTRRLKGDRFTAKLTYPGDNWSQGVLKQLVKEDPEQSILYIRVATYAPNLKEIKKLEACNGNERFEAYKTKLLEARSPSLSPPTVSFEEE